MADGDLRTTERDPAARQGEAEEARLWAAFATATTTHALCRAWLGLAAQALPGLRWAAVVWSEGGSFVPVAGWPDDGGLPPEAFEALRPVAERSLADGHPLVERMAQVERVAAPALLLGYPFLAETDRPAGTVVALLDAVPDDAVPGLLRALHMRIGWLEAQALRERTSVARAALDRAAAALDIVAAANSHDRPEAAAMAVANALSARLGGVRVAVALRRGRDARLSAISATAWFKPGTALVRAIEAAAEEAMDQDATICLPSVPGAATRIALAHATLREAWGGTPKGLSLGSVATAPMRGPEGAAGALLLHRPDQAPLTDDTLRLLDAVAALLGPILAAKQGARRWVAGRLADGARGMAAALLGPRHMAWKLGGGAAAAVLLAAALIPGPLRISARAAVEGQVQRAASVPFAGFIARAPARAGDTVRAGDVLAEMEDRDLRLERLRWASERDQTERRLRAAAASHDRAAMGQVRAQLRQAEAQLALAEEKLARTRIVAPIDGIVVSGDLTQMIGAPVDAGRVLFEVAPPDGFRFALRVDERDMPLMGLGQPGTLVLSGLAREALPVRVTRLTAVAEAQDGRNSFRAEAVLAGEVPPEAAARLRPGMEGIAKVEVDRRSWLRIWTRSLSDWVRLTVWKWTP